MTVVLDHLAIGTPALTDGWELFGGVLGGTWAYGGDSPGFWWGQLEFAAGPKIELLTPTGGPDAAFLERFLAARGAGPHHFNFLVSDIEATLARVRALGIEPVGVNLDNPNWKEAFLHPRERARHRHPGGPAGRGAAGGHAARRAARARPADLVRPDRAPRRRPGRRDAAVHRGPGRPARGRRRRRRRADLARRQADQAGARGRPAARRVAAPRPLHPRRRHVQRPGPGAGGPAGQAPRPDGGAGRRARRSRPRRVAEADGNRTRQRRSAALTGFEDRGDHQVPRRLRVDSTAGGPGPTASAGAGRGGTA